MLFILTTLFFIDPGCFCKYNQCIVFKFGIGEIDGSGGSFPDDDDSEDDCPEDMYLCNVSSRCILMTQLCDIIDDCGDQEDESISICGT